MQASFRSSASRGVRAVHRRNCSHLEEDHCGLEPTASTHFYEACGHMISAQGQKPIQERLIAELMSYPNQAVCFDLTSATDCANCTQWDAIITQANNDPTILQDGETIKVVGNIMKTNVAACTSIGSYFYPQIGRIYHDMLSMYRATSQMISDSVTRDGKKIEKTSMESYAYSVKVLLQPRCPKFAVFERSRRRF